MNTDSPRVRQCDVALLLPAIFLALSLGAYGCGSSEEATDEEWEKTPTVAPTTKLEYKIDSLQNENRRMAQQVEAVTAENRRLTARTAELESKLTETAATPKVATPITASRVSPSNSRAGYSAALDQFNNRNYQGAIDQFDALLKANAGDDLAVNCHYWMGESYYGLKNYKEAIRHFEMVFNYKASGKKPYAQLMLGNAYAALGNTAEAKEAYGKVVSDYPTSSLVAKAQARLAKMK